MVGASHNWMNQQIEPIPGRQDTCRLGLLALPFF